MKRFIVATAVLALALGFFQGCKSKTPDSKTESTAVELKDSKDKLSYTLGVQVGTTMHAQKVELKQDSFSEGLKDGLAEKVDRSRTSYGIGAEIGQNLRKTKTDLNQANFMAGLQDAIAESPAKKMTETEMRETMMNWQKERMEAAQKEHQAEVAKNLEDGNKFLEANGKKKDVVTLPSGLQYRVIKEGSGESPKATDKVKTNYTGKLIDGKEFDSSAKHGKDPAEFAVNAVIPAWTEALQLMKPGAKWEIYVPAKLGYGEQGNQSIPANSVLIFEMELVSVEKVAPPEAAPEKTAPEKSEAKPSKAQKPAPAKK